MNDQLYLMDCDNARGSWKAWQIRTFNEARRFNRQLFTKDQILAFGHHLNLFRMTQRNSEPIRMPDWDWCRSYNVNPSIGIGNGCAVGFIPVAKFYDGK